jgi:hypothetical protein
MHNLKLYLTVVFLFLLRELGISQIITNGYYNCTEYKTFIYISKDTIIIPFYNGTMSVNILKGVFDHKKWINFIPIKNKLEVKYYLVENIGNDTMSIPFSPILYIDKHKRMKYKYLDGKQILNIRFNFPFDNTWHQFDKTNKSFEMSYQQLIEKHFP